MATIFKSPKASDEIPTQIKAEDQNRFSLIELRKIHLQLIENKKVDEKNISLVIEILRVLAEMVVYGDNKSELLFDFFCEKNMLSLFLEIMRTDGGAPMSIHIQILQTLSILISSVKNDTSLYYLLSNNHINDIINFPHKLNVDESLDAQLASFIKTLSLRLNEQTVQFFFIEETGAFPLLAKAIQLLEINDPMIRISAQTAILNVYQVKDERARNYALDEEVLQLLFRAMVAHMKNQLKTLHSLVLSGTNSEDATAVSKIDQSIDDITITIEDWLYYLQDLLDLNIFRLQQSLITTLLHSFIIPELLSPLVAKEIKDDQSRMNCLEIEEDNSEFRLKGNSFVMDSNGETSEVSASVCLTYLLQMSRIISSPYARFAILLAFSHPLSCESREMMISVIEQRLNSAQLSSAGDVFLSPNETLPSQLKQNETKAVFKLLSRTENQRIPLLMLLILRNLICNLDGSALFEYPQPVETQSFSITGKILECLQYLYVVESDLIPLLPVVSVQLAKDSVSSPQNEHFDGEHRSWKKSKIAKSSYPQKFIITPDFLLPPSLFLVQALSQHSEISCPNILDSVGNVLRRSCLYSLTAIQVATYFFWDLFNQCFLVEIVNSTRKVVSIYNEVTATKIIAELRDISKVVATNLLSLVENQFSEIVLTVINEEIVRFNGRKWKSLFPRLLTNKYLLLPKNPASDPLGIDFSIPVSQVENLRKSIQTFLMIRALYFACERQLRSTDPVVDNDFLSLIDDKNFLCLDEMSLIPPNFQVGKYFDMKGRKFLDCRAISTQDYTNQQDISSEGNSQGNGSIWSASASVLSLGLINSGRKSTSKSALTSSKRGKEKESDETKLLFVQDPNLLIFVSQQRVDGKSAFKVFLIVPLIYADAKIDLDDRCKFKLVVRSWYPQPNMIKTDSELLLSQEVEGLHLNKTPAVSFLKPPEKSFLFYSIINLETEQACALAVQHIESRRKLLTTQKLEKLKSILNNWRDDGSENIN